MAEENSEEFGHYKWSQRDQVKEETDQIIENRVFRALNESPTFGNGGVEKFLLGVAAQKGLLSFQHCLPITPSF